MRPLHVKFRIEQQLNIRDFIKNAVNNLIKGGTSNLSSSRIEIRRSALREHWEKFTITHDAITIAMMQLHTTERDKLSRHRYFRDQLFQKTQELYLESEDQMTTLLTNNSQQMTRTTSAASTSQSSVIPSIPLYASRLPRIELPKFDGTSSEWLPFKDLFDSLVLSNPSLSAVEKLQYLKTSVVGDAAPLLKNTALTADNFPKAWEALVLFYENKRLLVNSALHSLVSLKRITKESGTELEKLYTDLMQIYRTLETLQRPVDTWDDFLVFIAVERLDSESVKAWEGHLGSTKEPPTWKQFTEFLMTRMRSLQAFEKSRPHKAETSIRPHIKTHLVNHSPEQQPFKSRTCQICSDKHWIAKCPQFINKTVDQKIESIKKHNLCFNCLGHHRASVCPSVNRCLKCGSKHHSTIHRINTRKDKVSNSDTTAESTQVTHAAIDISKSTSFTLLATAQVLVTSEKGEKIKARALIDPGSQISFLSERLAQTLHLPRQNSSIMLHGIGAIKAGRTNGIVSVTLTPHFNISAQCSLMAHVLRKLTSDIPTAQADSRNWTQLRNLTLADPDFHKPGQIDILIGSDYYGEIIEEGLKKGPRNSPIAQRTIFGWVISGPPNPFSSPLEVKGFHVSIDRQLHESLQTFWQLEEIPSYTKSTLSTDEQECEDHFQTTHTRAPDGRYMVRLPFKQPMEKLGDSFANARRILYSLQRRFKGDSMYHEAYSNFLKEYKTMNHMEQVLSTDEEPIASYYLPHHGVTKDNSLTTKLRVVFNGSSRSSSGVSLNDILHTGAKLQVNLSDVLLWFRRFRYVFSSDIEKMYRQIKVHPEDWDFQRILWINDSSNIITFRLTTVTYGLACAPFLALRTMIQLIEDEGKGFPLAVPPLTQGRYVDDVLGGADTIEELQEITNQTSQLCMAGGFPLKKWISNHPDTLKNIPSQDRLNSPSIILNKGSAIHTLGLCWNPTADTFHFIMKIPRPKFITKRTILSTIAQVFDPLGFLTPMLIQAKIFIQELWTIKLGWDDTLPPHLSNKWLEFCHQLQELPQLSFPRWLEIETGSLLELHGFCDASQKAIAAVVYIRSTTNGITQTVLTCSKGKVAPIKRLTIPRLELSGAVILSKLVIHVTKALHLTNIPIYMWTDSGVVHTWLTNHPSRWKEFVHNRVCYIQETVPNAMWRLVPGRENPADCATRGLTASQLAQYYIWLTGPEWLKLSPSAWPEQPRSIVVNDNLEERPSQVTTTITTKPAHQWDLLSRYSRLTKLLRVTATCQRVISRLRKLPESALSHPLTTADIEQARNYWIKAVQESHFRKELNILLKGDHLAKSHSLSRLTPFVDKSGFLRVGGRLQSSALPASAKHPFILPKESLFSRLIIDDAHTRTLHGGTQLTLFYVREYYWILGGRAPIRSLILKCIPCTRYRQQRAEQLMGQLPAARVNPSRPFIHSGVDYAGPVSLKTWRGRNARSYKAYIALFVCLSTSAVHIELVTDYTTDAFIAAYKRFTARRGICATLRSDCGTNLKGADAELHALFSSASEELKGLASLLAADGTQWIFNPPSAPHFGGKWEAGIKSVKYHLRRIIGDHTLTYEEMNTLLIQIEAVLNSRPLSTLTEDPDDLSTLTPGHFLIGGAPSIIPEPSLNEEKPSRLSRWQHIRQMLDSFWTKWSKECLQRYQAIYKWKHSTDSIKQGSLVLIIDERYPPAKWPLGRIIRLHPGNDGLTRVVTIRTQASTLKRPITKICPLPIETDTL